MRTFHAFAQVAAFAVGAVLVYLGTFLYETTENRIQNGLEDFWLSLEYDNQRPIGIARRLTRAVVILSDRIFDRLFGGSDFSAQSISVAWCFATAGIVFSVVPLFLFAALADIDRAGLSKALVFSLQFLTIAGLAALFVGLLPALHRSLRWITYGVVVVQNIGLGLVLSVIRTRPEARTLVAEYGVSGTILAVVVNLLYGILVVHVMRYSIHALATQQATRGRLRLMASTFIVTLSAFVANAFVATMARHPAGRLAVWMASLFQKPIVMFLLYSLAAPMSLWAVGFLALAVLAAIVLLHVWLWPVFRFVLMKTTYAAHRHQLIRQHTKLRAAGLSLVAFAIGGRVFTWVEQIFTAARE